MPETTQTLTESEQARLKELRRQVHECSGECEQVRVTLGHASRELAQAEERLHRAERELIEYVTGILSARRLAPGDYRVSPDEGRIVPVRSGS